MWLTLIFWCFIVMIELTVEIKSNILWLTRSKIMALTSEREIVADNGMSLTCPSHLEQVLDCKKEIKHKVNALDLQQRY